LYLNHLAVQNQFEAPEFIAYLAYLQYWSKPEYAKFLSYPGPSLRALELLQQKKFRAAIVMPGLVMKMMEEGSKARPE
jgi:mediator of RNA polymerase II transcription subunit 31